MNFRIQINIFFQINIRINSHQIFFQASLKVETFSAFNFLRTFEEMKNFWTDQKKKILGHLKLRQAKKLTFSHFKKDNSNHDSRSYFCNFAQKKSSFLFLSFISECPFALGRFKSQQISCLVRSIKQNEKWK